MKWIIVYDLSQVDKKEQEKEIQRLFDDEKTLRAQATLYIKDQSTLNEFLTTLCQSVDYSAFEAKIISRLKVEYRSYYKTNKYGFKVIEKGDGNIAAEDLVEQYLDHYKDVETLFIVVRDRALIDTYFNNVTWNQSMNIEVHRYEKYELSLVEVQTQKDMEFLWSIIHEDVGILTDDDMYDLDEWIGATKQDFLQYFQSIKVRNFNKKKFVFLNFALSKDRLLQSEPEDRLETFLRGHDARINSNTPINYRSYFMHYEKELMARELMYKNQITEINTLRESHMKERQALSSSQVLDYKPFLKSNKTPSDDDSVIDDDTMFQSYFMCKRMNRKVSKSDEDWVKNIKPEDIELWFGK